MTVTITESSIRRESTGPVAPIKPIRLNNKRRRILRDEEQEEYRLLEACEQNWFKSVLIFAIETGLRLNEICSLKKEQFFLSNGIAHFVLTREKNSVETKFPIASERLLKVIKEQIESSSNIVYLFSDDSGNPVTTHMIVYWLKKTTGKAGLKNLTSNDLRRTFCSRLYWMGCNPVFVEYLMGHTVNGIHSHYFVHNLGEIYDELVSIEEKKKQKAWHTFGIPEENLVAVERV